MTGKNDCFFLFLGCVRPLSRRANIAKVRETEPKPPVARLVSAVQKRYDISMEKQELNAIFQIYAIPEAAREELRQLFKKSVKVARSEGWREGYNEGCYEGGNT